MIPTDESAGRCNELQLVGAPIPAQVAGAALDAGADADDTLDSSTDGSDAEVPDADADASDGSVDASASSDGGDGGDGADGGGVARRGGGETGFDDIDIQRLKRARDDQLRVG